MADHVYSKTEVVGTSEVSIDDAIRTALVRASETIREIGWFEVAEIRGHVDGGELRHFQVTVSIGFTLEDTKSA